MGKQSLYLAYGSNLHLGQMSYRCPDAVVQGSAILNDHMLLFRGSGSGCYATVEPCPGQTVPVGVWRVSEKDIAALDRYEGYPSFYDKVDVLLDDQTVAFMYVMTGNRFAGMPSQSYLQTIRNGYDSFGFDKSVIDRALEDTGHCMDEERLQRGSPEQLTW